MNRLRMRNVAGRKTGFTLIELLVVIAIIALLISILLPSLEAARRQSKKSACLAHIKNIASSSRVYEADDPQGWGVPVHAKQYQQDPTLPTYIGAYEWGGKSGIGKEDYLSGTTGNILDSKYGTAAGFGPASRPMNDILYKGGFVDNSKDGPAGFNRPGAEQDTKLDLGLFKCPGDDGPPRGAHCPDWLLATGRSSYDHFGNSFVANVFMIAGANQPGAGMFSNSPYLRPISRVPTPARTLYYEENIGRWAWCARRELCDLDGVAPGVDPGPTKAIRGWHGQDWTFNRAFVDAHAESQKIWIEGTEQSDGYASHYRNEIVYPEDEQEQEFSRCIIVRGNGWQKDTLPSDLIDTKLTHNGNGRPSYEGCVSAAQQ